MMISRTVVGSKATRVSRMATKGSGVATTAPKAPVRRHMPIKAGLYNIAKRLIDVRNEGGEKYNERMNGRT